ncbi:MAG: hypothetical protein M0R46_16240 [Candidatus Muirbacterium halophilum]|nr:hypothetical protein [Candidatus Muirbacterium halophilum]MCK9477467.1 hypothetical protein [Candidatus Muirbacterium halophilum]
MQKTLLKDYLKLNDEREFINIFINDTALIFSGQLEEYNSKNIINQFKNIELCPIKSLQYDLMKYDDEIYVVVKIYLDYKLVFNL